MNLYGYDLRNFYGLDGITGRDGRYLLRYARPSEAVPDEYALSVQCASSCGMVDSPDVRERNLVGIGLSVFSRWRDVFGAVLE